MKQAFKKFVSLFSRYDVPADATWSKQSIAAQTKKQDLAALIADNKAFLETKGYKVEARDGSQSA